MEKRFGFLESGVILALQGRFNNSPTGEQGSRTHIYGNTVASLKIARSHTYGENIHAATRGTPAPARNAF